MTCKGFQEELEKVQSRAARLVTRNYTFEEGSMTGILGQLKWECLFLTYSLYMVRLVQNSPIMTETTRNNANGAQVTAKIIERAIKSKQRFSYELLC